MNALFAPRNEDLLILGSQPSLSLFRITFMRHTLIAQETLKKSFDQAPDFGIVSQATIHRMDGDLMHHVVLQMTLPAVQMPSHQYFAWLPRVGYTIIQQVQLLINDQMIDELYGDWINVWYELRGISAQSGWQHMVGDTRALTRWSNYQSATVLQLPLPFWFDTCIGQALPLCALKESVKIQLTCRALHECCLIGPTHSVILKNVLCHFEPFDTLINENNQGLMVYYDALTRRLFYNLLQGEVFKFGIIRNDKYENRIDERSSIMTYEIHYPVLHLGETFLWLTCMYLEENERVKFMTHENKYVIESVQRTSWSLSSLNEIKSWIIPAHSKWWAWTTQIALAPYARINALTSASIYVHDILMIDQFTSDFYQRLEPHVHHLCSHIGLYFYAFTIHPFSCQPATVLPSFFTQAKIDMTLNTTCNMNMYVGHVRTLWVQDGKITFQES